MGMSPWPTKLEIKARRYVFHMRDITCTCGNKWTETTISYLTNHDTLSFEMRPYHPNGQETVREVKIVGYCVSKEAATFCYQCFTQFCNDPKEIKITQKRYDQIPTRTSVDKELDDLFGEAK